MAALKKNFYKKFYNKSHVTKKTEVKMLKLVNGFDRLSDPDIGVRATQIVEAITNNSNFPAPSPAVPEANVILAAYFNALSGRMHLSLADNEQEVMYYTASMLA